MKKIIFFLFVSVMVSACAKATFPEAVPGSSQVKTGLSVPPVYQCKYVATLATRYGNAVLGQGISNEKLRQGAIVRIKNDAAAHGANFVYIKRVDAQISGAFNYNRTTAVIIYGDAFHCKQDYLKNVRASS